MSSGPQNDIHVMPQNSKECIEMVKFMGQGTADQHNTAETEMLLYDNLVDADFHDFYFHDD